MRADMTRYVKIDALKEGEVLMITPAEQTYLLATLRAAVVRMQRQTNKLFKVTTDKDGNFLVYRRRGQWR